MRTPLLLQALSVVLACSVAPGCARNTAADDTMKATDEVAHGESDEDRAITQHIQKKIAEDRSLAEGARAVTVSTYRGTVTLTGSVRTGEQKAMVTRLAQHTPEVRLVADQVNVDAP